MRRIVVIASGMSGVSCATRIKRRLPQSEVNVIIPASLSEFQSVCQSADKSALGPASRRLAQDLPDLETLHSREVGVIEAADIMPDLEEREVTVTSSRGTVSIRYTELILDIPATVRLPRSLQNADNVFGWPMTGFSDAPILCDKSLAEAVSRDMPVLVVGGGAPALDAVFLAREAGAKVHWVRTGERDIPDIEPQLLGIILKEADDALAVSDLSTIPPEQIVRTMNAQGTRLESITLPDGTVLPCSCCLWTSPLMAIHPILREDGVSLDTLGHMELSETSSTAKSLYLVGNGAAVPPALLPGAKLPAPVYMGGQENASLSCGFIIASVADAPSLTASNAGSMGVATAGMTGLAFGRAGYSLSEAAASGFEAEYAIVSLPGWEEKAGGQSFILSLVCEKKSRTLIGAQVLGKNTTTAAVDGLLNMALAAMAEGTSLSSLCARPRIGLPGKLFGMAGDILQNKLSTAIKGINPDEFLASHASGADFFTLDLRSPHEWEQGHIPGAYNIPLPQLKKRLQAEVPHFTPIVLVSRDGKDAYATSCLLNSLGATDLYVLDGGMELWSYSMKE